MKSQYPSPVADSMIEFWYWLQFDYRFAWSIGKDATVPYLKIGKKSSFSPVHSKNRTPVLGNAIPVLGVKLKRGWYVIWLFFKIDLCSAISFKRSRRELSVDVAEHRPILKNKGVVRILVIFQDRLMFSHIVQKVSARAFRWCGWTSAYLEK